MLFSNKLRDLSYRMFSAWNIFSENDSWMNEVIFWKHKWDLRNDTWKQPLVVLQQLLMCLSGRTKAHLALSRLAVKRQENQQSFISTRALCAIYNRCSVLFSFFQRQRACLGVAFLFPPRHFSSGARPSNIEVVIQKNVVLELWNFTSWNYLSFMPPYSLLCLEASVCNKAPWMVWVSLYLFGQPTISN